MSITAVLGAGAGGGDLGPGDWGWRFRARVWQRVCVDRGRFRGMRVTGKAGGGGNEIRAGDSGAGWREKFRGRRLGGERFRDRARRR